MFTAAFSLALVVASCQSAPVPSAVQQQVAALKKDYDAAQSLFYEHYQKAESDDAKQKLFESEYPKLEAWAPKFLALAEQAKGEPAALDCFCWIVGHQPPPELAAKVYDLALAGHAAQEELSTLVRLIGRYTSDPSAEKFLRAVLEKTPHASVKGYATYSLALFLVGANRDDARKEVEQLLEKVVSDYGQLEGRRGTLGAAATNQLFELRNLQIGMTAPEVEGADVDGAPFKLSDYRGKVVVLDFWGFW